MYSRVKSIHLLIVVYYDVNGIISCEIDESEGKLAGEHVKVSHHERSGVLQFQILLSF